MNTFTSRKELDKYILSFSKDSELAIIRGSTAFREPNEFDDLDVEIYSKKEKKPFYEIILYKEKVVLLTIYFYKFQKGNSIEKESINVLKGEYNDKIDEIFEKNFFKKDKYTIKEKIVRENQLVLDFLFKYLRKKEDKVFERINKRIKFED